MDRIHDLLRRFEIPSKRDQAELDRALGPQTLEGWVTQRIAEGKEIAIAPDRYDGTYARPVDTLSVDQFRALAETVRSIAHVGREEQQVTLDAMKAERAAVVAEMLGAMADLPAHDVPDFANQGGATGIRGSLEGVGKAASAFHAMLLKPEAIIDRLDGDNHIYTGRRLACARPAAWYATCGSGIMPARGRTLPRHYRPSPSIWPCRR